jgi:hypothetical protein
MRTKCRPRPDLRRNIETRERRNPRRSEGFEPSGRPDLNRRPPVPQTNPTVPTCTGRSRCDRCSARATARIAPGTSRTVPACCDLFRGAKWHPRPKSRCGPEDRSSDDLGSMPGNILRDVGIDISGDSDISMPKSFRYRFERNTVLETDRRERVAETVSADGRETVPACKSLNSLGEPFGRHEPPVAPREHESNWIVPATAGSVLMPFSKIGLRSVWMKRRHASAWSDSVQSPSIRTDTDAASSSGTRTVLRPIVGS